MTMVEILNKVCSGRDLTRDEMLCAAGRILEGATDIAQSTEFLRCLTAKGETDEELLCMLDVMSKKAVRIQPRLDCPVIDVCGTGGDMQQTFNISTAASFIAAAAAGGIPAGDPGGAADGATVRGGRYGRGCAIAKHGNRSSSGVSGSADVFESIGYDNDAEPDRVCDILEAHRICFIFAQKFHPAMRHVAAARKALGRRTAFNTLGPLANPAGVRRQLVGVASADLLYRISRILLKRGARMAMVVMSNDGMDELSTSSSNMAVIADGADGGCGRMTEMVIRPEDVGLHRSEIHELRVSSVAESAAAVVGAIDGTAAAPITETAVLNAAGALMVAGVADDIRYAVDVCYESVKSGSASRKLDEFAKHAGSPALLEEIRHGP